MAFPAANGTGLHEQLAYLDFIVLVFLSSRSSLWVLKRPASQGQPNSKSPWVLSTAALAKLIIRSVERGTNLPVQLKKMGRNLGIVKLSWMLRLEGCRRQPFPAVKDMAPKSTTECCVNYTTYSYAHKSTVPAMCYLMFHGRVDPFSWGSGIIPKGYSDFSFGLVGNGSSYTK